VVQFLFTTLTRLFYNECNLLKARVVIYAYNHHVRLLSPEPAVVDKPQSTRVKEPTLLCNHLREMSGYGVYQALADGKCPEETCSSCAGREGLLAHPPGWRTWQNAGDEDPFHINSFPQ
jgi:hypothetical protein